MKRTVLFLAFCLLMTPVLAKTQIYFSPNGGCTSAIVQQINGAQKTIDIMMYSFTSRPIAEALVKAKERGVVVRVLLDKAQRTQEFSKSRYFAGNGIAVKFDQGKGLMHNKVGLIDGKVLLTGSFNWTAQAEKYNQENLLVVDDPELIKAYQARFDSLWH